MDRYIKHKITKDVLLFCDENDLSIEGAKKLLITDGKTVADYEIGTATFEEIKTWSIATSENLKTYADRRKAEYPPMEDYLDGIVKGDQVQIDKYVSDCLAIKEKFPKE